MAEKKKPPTGEGFLSQGKLPIYVTGLKVKITDPRFEIKRRDEVKKRT